MPNIYNVIDTISLTEKASALGEKNNEYVFKVNPKATKIEIRQAVEKLFGKTVIGVRTINVDGKLRRRKRADAGRAPNWKKAIVRLKTGERIEVS
jgi:large subunit ribosomal protein L23